MLIVNLKAVDVNNYCSKAVDLYAVDAKRMLDNAMRTMHSPISEEDLRSRFAKNLRNQRTFQGISQEALADLAGVHRTFVSQVERGQSSLSLGSMRKLANALGVDPVELFKL